MGYDADNDPIKFESLNDTSPFSIETTGEGIIKLAKELDFEYQTQYTLDKI